LSTIKRTMATIFMIHSHISCHQILQACNVPSCQLFLMSPICLILLFNSVHSILAHCRNLAVNNLSGSLPYSISSMVSLSYLWVACLECIENLKFCQVIAEFKVIRWFNIFGFRNVSPDSLSSLQNISIFHKIYIKKYIKEWWKRKQHRHKTNMFSGQSWFEFL